MLALTIEGDDTPLIQILLTFYLISMLAHNNVGSLLIRFEKEIRFGLIFSFHISRRLVTL